MFVYFRFRYELLVYQGTEINESLTPAYRTIANEPPIMFQPSDIVSENMPINVYTVGVRIVTDQVGEKKKHYFI